MDTNILLDLKEGQIYRAHIIDIKKNECHEISEVIGKIDENSVIGNIVINSQFGVYGKLENKDLLKFAIDCKIARIQDVHVGDAYIITDVLDNQKRFKVKIEKILPLYKNSTKAFVIKITDKKDFWKSRAVLCKV
ncbi:hypothetical protein OTK00_001289 [Caldicellulosiruptor morganii]|uniref:Peptidase S55 domain-containing protein n=1 Tax=Caldicellulosiruptor morganii TaxID=1387555 RepID=A0ABY7BT82_9FIRM|nr:hypothetical protein OTK00_001289 [Caldicellulosiruptor morganii]